MTITVEYEKENRTKLKPTKQYILYFWEAGTTTSKRTVPCIHSETKGRHQKESYTVDFNS